MKKIIKSKKKRDNSRQLEKQKNRKALKIFVTAISSYFVYLSHVNRLPRWTMIPSIMLILSMWLPISWTHSIANILSYILTPIYFAYGYFKGWYKAFTHAYGGSGRRKKRRRKK